VTFSAPDLHKSLTATFEMENLLDRGY